MGSEANDPPGGEATIVVAVCTRNRPRQVRDCLDALARQTDARFSTVVVDQSDDDSAALADWAAQGPRRRILSDQRRGLSRARNLAVAATEERWLVFVDDDCRLAADWIARARDEIAIVPEPDLLVGHLAGVGVSSETAAVPQATFPVEHRRTVTARGRSWRQAPWPYELGFGACLAVRRDVVERLRGWDEALGAGSGFIPAADDMDFNHRFLRAGFTAQVTPMLRAEHELWREPGELVRLMRDYHAGWMGFAAKTLKQGDRRAGLRLTMHGVREIWQWGRIGARERSWLMGRIVVAKVSGGMRGWLRGLSRDWGKVDWNVAPPAR